MRSLSKCALSLACPQGRLAAGAEKTFSRKRIVGIDPPSRMKMGFTAAGEVDGVEDPVAKSGVSDDCVSDLVRMGNEDEEGSSGDAAVWVRVEDVGTVADCKDRLRAAAFSADEVVVDVITRSTRDARLSEESFRRRPGPAGMGGLGVTDWRPFLGRGIGGY